MSAAPTRTRLIVAITGALLGVRIVELLAGLPARHPAAAAAGMTRVRHAAGRP